MSVREQDGPVFEQRRRREYRSLSDEFLNASREVRLVAGEELDLRESFTWARFVMSTDRPGVGETLSRVKLEGFARDETINDWLKGGKWRRTDIHADAFSLSTRRGNLRYEIPSGHVIKALGIHAGNHTVLRILTREPVGAEAAVSKRFTKTGKASLSF